jgi:hypothetical protein
LKKNTIQDEFFIVKNIYSKEDYKDNYKILENIAKKIESVSSCEGFLRKDIFGKFYKEQSTYLFAEVEINGKLFYRKITGFKRNNNYSGKNITDAIVDYAYGTTELFNAFGTSKETKTRLVFDENFILKSNVCGIKINGPITQIPIREIKGIFLLIVNEYEDKYQDFNNNNFINGLRPISKFNEKQIKRLNEDKPLVPINKKNPKFSVKICYVSDKKKHTSLITLQNFRESVMKDASESFLSTPRMTVNRYKNSMYTLTGENIKVNNTTEKFFLPREKMAGTDPEDIHKELSFLRRFFFKKKIKDKEIDNIFYTPGDIKISFPNYFNDYSTIHGLPKINNNGVRKYYLVIPKAKLLHRYLLRVLSDNSYFSIDPTDNIFENLNLFNIFNSTEKIKVIPSQIKHFVENDRCFYEFSTYMKFWYELGKNKKISKSENNYFIKMNNKKIYFDIDKNINGENQFLVLTEFSYDFSKK